jgi:hypothetical protein
LKKDHRHKFVGRAREDDKGLPRTLLEKTTSEKVGEIPRTKAPFDDEQLMPVFF